MFSEWNSISLAPCIQFLETSILAKTSGHMEHIIREVTEIEVPKL